MHVTFAWHFSMHSFFSFFMKETFSLRRGVCVSRAVGGARCRRARARARARAWAPHAARAAPRAPRARRPSGAARGPRGPAAMSLPLVKLASLAVKTASKPLANRIKSQLKESPVWQGRALSFMQWYHRTSINAQRSMAGYSDDKEVKPMSETRAVSEFADMVGEGFVFGVALALVIWENSRKASSDDKARKAGLAADKVRTRAPLTITSAHEHGISSADSHLSLGSTGPQLPARDIGGSHGAHRTAAGEHRAAPTEARGGARGCQGPPLEVVRILGANSHVI